MIKKRFDSVLLLSGGIDSYVTYFYLDKTPQPIYYDLNSKYSHKEINHLIKIKNYLNHDIIVDNTLQFLGEYEKGEKAFIPFRNLYLALHTATKYSNTIYIAGLKDDNVVDKNEAIFKQWSETLSNTVGEQIQVLSPFWNMTKADVVKWYANKYNKNELVDNTLSCYSHEKNHCFTCPACFRRNVALYSVGIVLPFYNKSLLLEYKTKIGKDIYNQDREINMSNYISHILNE